MRGDFTADLTPLREGDVGVLAGQLELACKRMNHLVAQLSREKTAIKDFMADVSHQLKTPLTALLTYLELLQGEADGRRREQLDRCVLLAARMDELTRALLDFARDVYKRQPLAGGYRPLCPGDRGNPPPAGGGAGPV